VEHKNPLRKNVHFWIIISISAFLVLIYLAWPWREWNFSNGVFQWLIWLYPLYNLAVFEVQYHIIGSLFLVPIIYSSIIFKWQGSLASLLFVIALYPLLTRIWNNVDSRITNIILLLSPIAIVLAVKIELELRQKEKDIFIEREKEYQTYLTKILETQEKERRRIAEELHDESVQTLLAVASYAESLELTENNMAEVKTKAEWIKDKTRGTVEDLRRMSIELRPGILDDMGLVSALKWLTDRINKERRVHVHLSINGLKGELDPALQVNIFRVVQESLRNIEQHAKARDAWVDIDKNIQSINITVRDNGQGFQMPEKFGDLVTRGKLGLIGMQERARSFKGTFEIHSRPGEGTILSISFPSVVNNDFASPSP
jgi:signal transduction histidine kinase